MSQKISAKDWIKAGLRALAREGFTAVKADILTKTLKVTRGSFYWHFETVEQFHRCVMQRWQDIATDAVIRQVERRARGGDRLHVLLRLAFAADPKLERAMRGWALSDPAAVPFVEKVDRLRLDYLERLLMEEGVAPDSARRRAGIIYWAYLGAQLSGARLKGATLTRLVDELALLARSGLG